MAEGFLRQYERAMGKYTDAPDVFHRAAGYAVYGALLCTNKVRLRIAAGPEPLWPNLWMVLVGGSAQSRKTTSIHFATTVATEADEFICAPDSFTPEGFAQYLYALQQGTQGAPKDHGPAALINLPEMSQFLLEAQRQYASANKSMLMSMYDAKSFRRQLSRSVLEVKLPRVGLLGGIAPELLSAHTDTADWQGGFMSRTMLVHGRRSRTLTDPTPVADRLFRDLVKVLDERLKTVARSRRKHKAKWKERGFTNAILDFEPSARKLWGSTPASHSDPALNFTLGRSQTHLAKMAAIEQVDMDPEAFVITEKAVRTALELWQEWWDSSPQLVRSCFSRSQADFGGDKLSLRIYRILMDCTEPVEQSLLMRASAVHANAFQAAIASLKMAAMVSMEVKKAADGTLETYYQAVNHEDDALRLLKRA
jgi:hypothetical protein